MLTIFYSLFTILSRKGPMLRRKHLPKLYLIQFKFLGPLQSLTFWNNLRRLVKINIPYVLALYVKMPNYLVGNRLTASIESKFIRILIKVDQEKESQSAISLLLVSII